MTGDNPLLQLFHLDHELPDFAHIRIAYLVPPSVPGCSDQQAEIAAITANPEEPTWDNTMDELEASGQSAPSRASAIALNFAGTDATPEVVEVEQHDRPGTVVPPSSCRLPCCAAWSVRWSRPARR